MFDIELRPQHSRLLCPEQNKHHRTQRFNPALCKSLSRLHHNSTTRSIVQSPGEENTRTPQMIQVSTYDNRCILQPLVCPRNITDHILSLARRMKRPEHHLHFFPRQYHGMRTLIASDLILQNPRCPGCSGQ